MRPAPFDYVRPATVSEALEALAKGGTPLAGGQSLLPQLKLRQVRPALLVDLNGLEELQGIEEDGGGLRIGAMTRHQHVADSDAVRSHAPVLSQAASRTADMQVRARGTIGGNVCHADPRANLSTALIAAGATAIVARRDGERRVAVEDLFAGVRRSALEAGDLLTAFEIPASAAAVHSAYEELTVQPNGVPIVNVGVAPCNGGTDELRIGIGGLMQTPRRAHAVEEAIRGESADRAAVASAVERLLADGEPMSDLHGDARYRARVAPVLVLRAVRRARESNPEGAAA
ncbi:MAG: aerobic carbon-monoxide dehydrogenase medium subunit [Solirubrobacteraceae bacterium]|jgi:carbon-monoxide dehydrogenase medium subunit|nr:aerobic carbon-monoxide dehydrogenase medium subunit [Solirubrobacteraceae bacterium]